MLRLRRQVLRQEMLANLRLALPIIATQISFMGMGAVDTIMAGRLGAASLAAVGVGSNIWFLFFVVFIGIFMACSPIIAHRVGAAEPSERIGAFVRGAAVLALVCGLIWMLSVRLAIEPLLRWLALDAPADRYAADYLAALSWSAVPMCLSFLARNVAEGHGLPRVALIAGLVAFAVNIVMDYVLMYGAWGFPELGPEGCGWASTIAAMVMLSMYLVVYARVAALRALRVFAPQRPAFRASAAEILRLGLPISLIVAAESWLFNLGALMMARFGGDVVAAHQVAINFAALSFMVPLSIGLATTVRVGHAAGAGLWSEVRLRGVAGVTLGVGFAAVSSSVMALFPALIVSAYTDEASVATLAGRFLLFAAVFQLFDGIQATAAGALRGVKDTRVPMAITVAAYWCVGLPLAALLAFRSPVGPYGVWIGFIVALALAALGLLLRYLRRTRSLPDAGSGVASSLA